MREAHARKAKLARDRADPPLVRRSDERVQQTHGEIFGPLGADAGEPRAEVPLCHLSEGHDRLASCARPRAELDDSRGDGGGPAKRRVEERRAALIVDEQEVGEPPVEHQRRRRSSPLEERVRRNRRPQAHVAGRRRLVRRQSQEGADTFHWRQVRRRELERAELPALGSRHDAIGEGPAAVDPDGLHR